MDPIEEIPCPACGHALRRLQQPPWRYSITSYVTFLLAGALGYFGYVIGTGRDSALLLWMAYVGTPALGLLAYRMPRVRMLACSGCGVSSRVASRFQRAERK